MPFPHPEAVVPTGRISRQSSPTRLTSYGPSPARGADRRHGAVVRRAAYSDRDHDRCAALLDTDAQIVSPAPVIVETEWLVTSRLGPRAFDAVYEDICSGALKVVDLSPDQWARVRQLCDRYADLPLGLVDASVVAVAETLGEVTIATLDHQHFTVVRRRHVAALDLVPR